MLEGKIIIIVQFFWLRESEQIRQPRFWFIDMVLFRGCKCNNSVTSMLTDSIDTVRFKYLSEVQVFERTYPSFWLYLKQSLDGCGYVNCAERASNRLPLAPHVLWSHPLLPAHVSILYKSHVDYNKIEKKTHDG